MKMGLKLLELQVALHRTQDAGKIQEQKNQRVMANQQLSSEEQKLKAEIEKNKSMKMEGKGDSKISSDDPSSNGHSEQKNKRPKNEEDSEMLPSHPFKGKHIDISL